MESAMAVVPARWLVGPPPPRVLTLFTRVLQLACFVVCSVWVFSCLGGLRLSPKPTGEGSNDTSGIFNWHPLLMTLAFPVMMGEALLAYKAPLVPLRDRSASKLLHVCLQTGAIGLAAAGLAPAFASHNRKRPTPLPNLYSTHSVLGLAVIALFGLQFLVGAFSYLWPKLSLAHRRALGPLHIFLGKCVFIAGLATMAVGIQEKTTFIQLLAKPGLRSAVMQLPAALQVLLLATGAAVLYHHVAPAAGASRALPSVVVETVEAMGGSGRPSFEAAPLRAHFDPAEEEHLS